MSRIAIFDSGVGGLSIYQEVVKQNPFNNFYYISDNQAFPYGSKDKAELVERVSKVVDRIDQHYAPDILIVACNTASTLVLPILRANYEFDIVGVVPAIKPAAKLSKNKQLAVLATPATIKRSYTDDLIEQFAVDCRVTRIGSSELVEIAESKLYGRPIDIVDIEQIIHPILDEPEIDTIVLACTHFPLLKDEITQVLSKHSRDISLVDSCAAIAKRVAGLSKFGEGESTQSATAVFTQTLNESYFLKLLVDLGFEQIDLLTV